MHAAHHWDRINGEAQCRLCPHACVIREGTTGRCGVRRLRQGMLSAEAYGYISSLAMDPIEKKPLFHVKPGTEILSVGSAGCNFRCSFCQNWTISQEHPPLSRLAPRQLIEEALEQGACGVAYTYNEPLINFEYLLDCARLARTRGLLNAVVTNGYIQPPPLAELLPLIDAWNIDIKSLRPEFYRRFCAAELAPVLETVTTVASAAHLEITHLVVTGGNDDLQQIAELVDWIAGLSSEIPLHLTRYYPQYRWEAPATDPELLCQARDLAKRKLAWVYLGNLGQGDDALHCPACNRLLVERRGYHTKSVSITEGKCPQCQRRIPGIF
ncbi:AmmeMemoRadiSam system radical SAM enzyme [candidate division FCPU426 bacterium]|nr:AmmeMemoRadiSam system radical SAM enzyme [candidate division FCPU426 bacterium]